LPIVLLFSRCSQRRLLLAITPFANLEHESQICSLEGFVTMALIGSLK
jgi:hypothetical protein